MVEMMVEVVEMMVEEDISQLIFLLFTSYFSLFLIFLFFSFFLVSEEFNWNKDIEEFWREYVTSVKCSVKGYVHVREIWKKCDVMDAWINWECYYHEKILKQNGAITWLLSKRQKYMPNSERWVPQKNHGVLYSLKGKFGSEEFPP